VIHFLCGWLAGTLSSVGVGPTNILVISCGLAGAFPSALAAGLGAFSTDAVFLVLAIGGVHLGSSHPMFASIFRVVSVLILAGMGWVTIRHAAQIKFRAVAQQFRPWSAYIAGAGFCFANPAILGFWFAVLVWFRHHGVKVVWNAQGWLFIAGACWGALAWFTLAAWLSRSVRKFLDGANFRRLVRVSGVLLLAMALFSGYEIIRDLILGS
jgi:threonine/homoserine/homoserine lactone efflux protein